VSLSKRRRARKNVRRLLSATLVALIGYRAAEARHDRGSTDMSRLLRGGASETTSISRRVPARAQEGTDARAAAVRRNPNLSRRVGERWIQWSVRTRKRDTAAHSWSHVGRYGPRLSCPNARRRRSTDAWSPSQRASRRASSRSNLPSVPGLSFGPGRRKVAWAMHPDGSRGPPVTREKSCNTNRIWPSTSAKLQRITSEMGFCANVTKRRHHHGRGARVPFRLRQRSLAAKPGPKRRP